MTFIPNIVLVVACNCRNSGSHIDEGDINAVNRFPITQLALGDVDTSGEYIHYTLGPLVCSTGKLICILVHLNYPHHISMCYINVTTSFWIKYFCATYFEINPICAWAFDEFLFWWISILLIVGMAYILASQWKCTKLIVGHRMNNIVCNAGA